MHENKPQGVSAAAGAPLQGARTMGNIECDHVLIERVLRACPFRSVVFCLQSRCPQVEGC